MCWACFFLYCDYQTKHHQPYLLWQWWSPHIYRQFKAKWATTILSTTLRSQAVKVVRMDRLGNVDMVLGDRTGSGLINWEKQTRMDSSAQCLMVTTLFLLTVGWIFSNAKYNSGYGSGAQPFFSDPYSGGWPGTSYAPGGYIASALPPMSNNYLYPNQNSNNYYPNQNSNNYYPNQNNNNYPSLNYGF